MTVLSIILGVGVIVASIAAAVQIVVRRLRGRPGSSVASTRAERATFLFAAAIALLAALVFALGSADSNAGNPFLAKYAAFGLIVAAAIFIWDVVKSDRASRRRNTPRSPPDPPSRP